MTSKTIYLLGQNVSLIRILKSTIIHDPNNVFVSIYPTVQLELWKRGFLTESFFGFAEELSPSWRTEFDDTIDTIDEMIYGWLDGKFGDDSSYVNLVYYFCRFYYVYLGIFRFCSIVSKSEKYSKVVVLEGNSVKFAGFNRELWSLHEDVIGFLSEYSSDLGIEIEFKEMACVQTGIRQYGEVGSLFCKNLAKYLYARMRRSFYDSCRLIVVSTEHQFPEKIKKGLSKDIKILRSSWVGFDLPSVLSSYMTLKREKIELETAVVVDNHKVNDWRLVERIFQEFVAKEGFWGLVEFRSKQSCFREMCLKLNPSCGVVSNGLGDSAVVSSVLSELGKPVLAVSHGSYSISNCQRANAEWCRHAKSMLPAGEKVEVGIQSLLSQSFFNEFLPERAPLIPIQPFGFGRSINESQRGERKQDRSDSEDPIILLLAPSFRSLPDYRPFVYQSEEEWARNLSVILEELEIATNTKVWISLRGGDQAFFVDKFRLNDLASNVKFLEPGEFKVRIDECDYVISDSSTAIEDALCLNKRLILMPFVNGYQHISDPELLYPPWHSNSVTICKDEKALRSALNGLVKANLASDTNYVRWIKENAQMSVNDWVALNLENETA